MTKIDVISGFLGAGKTTLIKKLIEEGWQGEKLVLIENEFGEIGIDSGFLQDAGIEIKEMNSGCICCSLVGDFAQALEKVMDVYAPDRIVIEPSGVGKLSDVVKAIQDLQDDRFVLHSLTTVVDGTKAKIYKKNFKEFFINQIEHAQTIFVSRSQCMKEDARNALAISLQEHNPQAHLVTTPWNQLNGKEMLEVMGQTKGFMQEVVDEMTICPVCHDHHNHEHHHEHHHDDTCTCGHHHHDHDADEVFSSWGKETTRLFDEVELQEMLSALSKQEIYGSVLRAKGMVESVDHTWLYFDYVPEEWDIRKGKATTIGKLCVIGSHLQNDAIATLFLSKEV